MKLGTYLIDRREDLCSREDLFQVHLGKVRHADGANFAFADNR
jgi:prepilin-type processing-associated H-X9-DG protein